MPSVVPLDGGMRVELASTVSAPLPPTIPPPFGAVTTLRVPGATDPDAPSAADISGAGTAVEIACATTELRASETVLTVLATVDSTGAGATAGTLGADGCACVDCGSNAGVFAD